MFRSLKKLEMELDSFQKEVESLFSWGMDKYNSYQDFTENFAADSLGGGFFGEKIELEEEESIEKEWERLEKEGEKCFRETMRNATPSLPMYPGIEIHRVPAGQLGYGILGRCFPYSGLIEIRSDLYGDDFQEVLTHELTHLQNPQMGEMDVRAATRLKLQFTPKWH
ncbi:MAG: hypothetical protein ISS93_03630 [Candidatus Aenigmarchaeota archaeon]|nr:hypothetical protein [Candidatus Aenigmarchaeota archaeon]